MGINVAQILRQAARQAPDGIAIVDVGHPGAARREHGFGELEQRARSVAGALAQRGLRRGDRVALIGENGADFVAAWFGCMSAGCTLVPVPVLTAAKDLHYRLQHSESRAVLFDAARKELVSEALAALPSPPLRLELNEACQGPALSPALMADTAPSADALLLYTSGTTGFPKGALISHASLMLHTAVLSQRALGLSAEDRVLGVLPLTHSFGCRMAMLAGFYAGARVVLMPRFDAARSLHVMREERVTWLPAVPTMFAAWGAQPEGDKPPALRWALSAGAPLADETALRAERRLGVEVRQGYGMTEATFCSINAPPDARVLGSVGRPVWGVDVRIVDERGQDVPAGTRGRVIARGHNVMTAYLHAPEATHAALHEDFFYSDDIGYFDDEGRLAVVDRFGDMIIRGGYNVYPAEVENAIAMHPEVIEVAVVGRADAYYGEEVVAIVTRTQGSTLTAEQVMAFAETQVGRTKRPREVVFVSELPRGATGKVHRRTLRQQLKDGSLVPIGVERSQDETKQ